MSARNLPYGYKMEKGIILIDETEAVYVRMIFESRSNGMGVYAIGKMLYEQQIPFFADSRDKSIKKASAILYKTVYIGDEKYPAIIDNELFQKVQEMKSAAFRKTKCEKEITVSNQENEEYELIVSEEIQNSQVQTEQMIQNRSVDSAAAGKLILELAAKKYSCIKRKEESL